MYYEKDVKRLLTTRGSRPVRTDIEGRSLVDVSSASVPQSIKLDFDYH